jgi:TnpA family transposase
MPVSFLTENERERLQRFPSEISPGDTTAFFTLAATDLAIVRKQRGGHNRMGFALQLCILRYLGFPLDDLTQLPEAVVTYVGQQLHVDPSGLELYGNRQKTRSEHLQEIQRHVGFHPANQTELDSLAYWLLDRALEHDKPSLLLQLLCEKLYQEKIIRPGIGKKREE